MLAFFRRYLFFLCASILFASLATADEGASIILRHAEGGRVVDYQYTSNATTTRLDRLGEPTTPPSPWHLIDRATGAITIIRPHNQSITTLATGAFERKPQAPQELQLPPGYEVPPEIAAALKNPGGIPAASGQAPARIGPDPALLPEGSTFPEVPSIPSTPAAPNLPQGMPNNLPTAGIPGGIPPMIPGGFPGIGETDSTPPGELIVHEETKTIHGYACQRHTMMLDRSLELELWLTESPALPPFYLLTWDGPPRFGGRNWLQEWPHAIRKAGKFPLLATLREKTSETQNPSPEISRWEIISIQPATPEVGIFHIPENHLNTDHRTATP